MKREAVYLNHKTQWCFDQFILAWDEELEEDKNLVDLYINLAKRNERLISVSRSTLKVGVGFVAFVGSTGFPMLIGIAVMRFTHNPTIGVAVAAVASAYVLYWILFGDVYSKGGITNISNDKRMLKRIERERGIRRSFFSKTFRK